MPDFKPYLVIGFALGGVYAMSGVGLVVLYRTTGVINLFYGAMGALASIVAWTMVDEWGWNPWLSYVLVILMAGVLTAAYGWFLGPPLANRDPLIKASASLGFALVLLGFMQWRWTPDARSLRLRTNDSQYVNGWLRINWTQAIGMIFPVAVTIATTVFLTRNKTGTAMRALADDREITATLGVPVRRVEAAAWLGSGLVCGGAGLLLSNLVGLDIVGLTFLVIPALAAALIGRLQSLWVTLAAGFLIGIVQSSLTAFSDVAEYRTLTPFVLAIVALLWFATRQRETTTGSSQ